MHIDDPHTRCQRHQRHAAGEDDVAAGPECLVDGKTPIPYQPEHHQQRAAREHAIQSLEDGFRLPDPSAGELAQHHGSDCRKRAQQAFGIPCFRGDPQVVRAEYQSIKPGIVYFNFYQPSNVTVAASTTRGALGAARPYLSEQTSILAYENKQTFQILSPGGDGSYGGRVAAAISGPASVILFTSKGSPCTAGPTSFVKTGGPAFILPEYAPKRPMHDNASNFTETNTLGENAG